MKRFLLALLMTSSAAFAQGSGKQSNVLIDVGFPRNGFKFGGAYEYVYNGAQGIGGQFHYYPKKTASNGNPGVSGVMVAGAFTGFHFYKGDWDFNLAPSMNIINIDCDCTTPGDKTAVGPGLAVNLTTALNAQVAIGFSFQNYWVWFGEDYRGKILDDLNFRVKIGF